MADELWNTLLRFHRKVSAPEIIAAVREDIAAATRRTEANFDAVWKRFDRLESEHYSLVAGVNRLEGRVAGLDTRVADLDIRVAGLDTRIAGLDTRVAAIEQKLP